MCWSVVIWIFYLIVVNLTDIQYCELIEWVYIGNTIILGSINYSSTYRFIFQRNNTIEIVASLSKINILCSKTVYEHCRPKLKRAKLYNRRAVKTVIEKFKINVNNVNLSFRKANIASINVRFIKEIELCRLV